MVIRQNRCIKDSIESPCGRICPSIPGVDALVFRAGPDKGGSLILNLTLIISSAGEMLTWRPGISEGELTGALASIRAFLRSFDTVEAMLKDTPLQCGRLNDGLTIILQQFPGDVIFGAAFSGDRSNVPPSRSDWPGESVRALGTEGLPEPVSAVGLSRLTSTAPPNVLGSGGDELARARLEALPTESRRIVQALAALGGTVSFARLGTLVESADDLVGILQTALDAGFVRWHARNGSAEVEDHLRSLIRSQMTPAERHAAHAWAEGWSVGLDSLLHRAAAAGAPQSALAEELEKEADALRGDGRADQAALLLRRAADLSPDAVSAVRRLLRSVEFQLRQHHIEEAREGLGSVSGSSTSTRHLLLSGRLSILEGDLRTGLVQLAEVRECLLGRGSEAAHDNADIMEAATLWLAQARWLADFPPQQIKPLLREPWSSTADDPFWSGLRDWLEIVLTAEEKGPLVALKVMSTTPPRSGRVPTSVRRRSLLTEAWLHLETGDLESCEGAVHEALDLRVINEDSSPDDLALVLLGHLHWLRGRWPLAQLCANMVTDSATPLWRPLAESLNELVMAARGKMARSVTPGEQDQQPALCQALALFCRIIAAVESGDPRDGEAVLDDLSSTSGLRVLTSRLMPWRALEVVRLAVLTGHETLLEESLESVRCLSTDPATPWMSMFTSWAKGLAAAYAGRRDDALSHYADAEGHAASSRVDAPWYRARLQADHAALLASVGKRRASLDRYRAAQETATRLGAQPLLDRCIEGLSRLRLPRHATGYGLTQREVEVARLVASGLTNKETATHLFITPASIAFHLGNIYAKIGVRNRYELRAWWNSVAGDG